MALGTFTPPPSKTAGSFKPQDHAGKPIIVVVREFLENHTTRRYPEPRDKVIFDVVDIMSDTVVISVMTGAGAIVDRLKDSIAGPGEEPTKLPVMFVKVAAANGGNDYYSVEPLEGTALQLAAAWDAKNPTRIEDERAAKIEADRAAEKANGNGNGNGNGSSGKPLTGLGSVPAEAANTTEPVTNSATVVKEASSGVSDADLEAMLAKLA